MQPGRGDRGAREGSREQTACRGGRRGAGGPPVSYGTSTSPRDGSTGAREIEPPARTTTDITHEWVEAFESALRLPVPPSGFWSRVGMSRRAERRLEIALGVLVYALAVGWVWSLSHLRTSITSGTAETATNAAARAAAAIASALTS